MSKNQTRIEDPAPRAAAQEWTSREAYLLALVCLFAGLALGYLFRGSSAVPALGASTAAQTPAAPLGVSPVADNSALHSAQALEPLARPFLLAIQADSKNVDALVQLGNLYYDHHVYPEAIAYYKRALELRPKDLNVRTDLGTAYWYSGFADPAVAEYQKVLAAQPAFAPALMNLGIVKLEGMKDAAGAIVAWEKLLATNPQHPERDRVLSLIERARTMKK